jgi:hypothetical protein
MEGVVFEGEGEGEEVVKEDCWGLQISVLGVGIVGREE